jgi:hypothetical protein
MIRKLVSFLAALAIFSFAVHADDGSPKGKRKVSVKCGGALVSITCEKTIDRDYPEDPRQCNHNTLAFTMPDGRVILPTPPERFDPTKTPVALSCRLAARDKRYYVVVKLSNGHEDCGPCTTYHLFDQLGNRLTADESDAMKQFARAVRQLGISYGGEFVRIEGGTK